MPSTTHRWRSARTAMGVRTKPKRYTVHPDAAQVGRRWAAAESQADDARAFAGAQRLARGSPVRYGRAADVTRGQCRTASIRSMVLRRPSQPRMPVKFVATVDNHSVLGRRVGGLERQRAHARARRRCRAMTMQPTAFSTRIDVPEPRGIEWVGRDAPVHRPSAFSFSTFRYG